ncbi:unnamed protein product [Heterobilharzia americana]|nr:unnamed protein product [Heterobilharzia americana]
MYNVPSTPFTAFKAFDEKRPFHSKIQQIQIYPLTEVKENLNVKCEAPNRSRDIPLPKSVEAAAAHFTSSLKSEANAGRLAWQNLLNVLSNGDIDGKSSESIGAMDEVITELTTALNERKEDLSNSVIFGERLRRALRLYASGDWFSAISSHLDPETNRLFSQLKRRARLAEAGLFDLEDQIQRLSSELDSLQKEKYSTRNGVGNNSPIIRALDTNANLIRAERGRIDYIVENLKRLGLSPMKCESKNDLKNAKQQTVRTSLNRSNVSFSKEDNVNPLRNMINERDQALFRLFSNYKLPIIHPSKVCPSISTEVESSKFTDSKGGDSFSDMQPSSDVHRNATTLSPSIKNSRLEQLLVVSGELASNTVVSTSPKTPLSTITKAETEAKKSTAVPLTPTTPLSKTPTSSLLSKPSLSMGLTKIRILAIRLQRPHHSLIHRQ